VVHTCSSSRRSPDPLIASLLRSRFPPLALDRHDTAAVWDLRRTANPEGLPPSLAQHGSCWRSPTSSSLPFQDAPRPNVPPTAPFLLTMITFLGERQDIFGPGAAALVAGQTTERRRSVRHRASRQRPVGSSPSSHPLGPGACNYALPSNSPIWLPTIRIRAALRWCDLCSRTHTSGTPPSTTATSLLLTSTGTHRARRRPMLVSRLHEFLHSSKRIVDSEKHSDDPVGNRHDLSNPLP
jgi:hypothetical protein